MAGEKGKRKRSSSSAPAEEHRGGEESAPKIRKVAQVDMGRREGKLQVKGKMRRLEEKGKEVAAVAPRDEVIVEAAADDPAGRKTEEKDCDHSMMFPEYAAPLFPGGAAQLEEVNAVMRTSAREFEEFEALDQRPMRNPWMMYHHQVMNLHYPFPNFLLAR
ncbi:hypothetical protein SEVIR_4G022702v4 [Setaria viridis]